jgi:hypothetical protein
MRGAGRRRRATHLRDVVLDATKECSTAMDADRTAFTTNKRQRGCATRVGIVNLSVTHDA